MVIAYNVRIRIIDIMNAYTITKTLIPTKVPRDIILNHVGVVEYGSENCNEVRVQNWEL